MMRPYCVGRPGYINPKTGLPMCPLDAAGGLSPPPAAAIKKPKKHLDKHQGKHQLDDKQGKPVVVKDPQQLIAELERARKEAEQDLKELLG